MRRSGGQASSRDEEGEGNRFGVVAVARNRDRERKGSDDDVVIDG